VSEDKSVGVINYSGLLCNYPYLHSNLVSGKKRNTIVVLSFLLESIMTVIEQLKHEAELLTEPLAQEVLDFLLFVRTRRAAGWPVGFFEETAGAWQGEPLERSPQGEQEQRLELK